MKPTKSEKWVWFWQGLALVAIIVFMYIGFDIPFPPNLPN